MPNPSLIEAFSAAQQRHTAAVEVDYRRRIAGSLSLDPTLVHNSAGRSRVASSRKVSL
jgi:hypothetical protein